MEGEAAITILGEKGQVVIPKRLRDQLHFLPKTRFIVFGSGDVLILKRLDLPELGMKWKQLVEAMDAKAVPVSDRDVRREVAAARRARRRRAAK